jgi:hypothetical protein
MLLSGRPGPLTDRQRTYLTVVEQAVQRLQGLIEDLLAFVQMDQGELAVQARPFAIGSLLEDCARLMTARATEKGLMVEVGVPPDLPDVLVEPKQIGRAVSLMLDNAIKFTPQGGRITLEAKACVAPDDAPVGWQQGYVEVALGEPASASRANACTASLNRSPRWMPRPRANTAAPAWAWPGEAIMEAHGTHVDVESAPGSAPRFASACPSHAQCLMGHRPFLP